MTKKKPFGTLKLRGRKGVFLGKNARDAGGRKFINIQFSTSNLPLGGKGKISSRSDRWIEVRAGSEGSKLSKQQLDAISDKRKLRIDAHNALQKTITGILRELGEKAYDKQGRLTAYGKTQLRLILHSQRNNSRTNDYKTHTRALKLATQKLLRIVRPGEDRSPFLTFQRNSSGRIDKFNIGFKKGGKDEWRESVKDGIRVMRGIKHIDIEKIVKRYGVGVIPSEDVTVYARHKSGKLKGQIKYDKDGDPIIVRKQLSVATTGVWWTDVKTILNKGTKFERVVYERQLNPELARRIELKLKSRRAAKRAYRRSKDPLIGTRKKGRPGKLKITSRWNAAEWAQQAYNQLKLVGYNNAQHSSFRLRLVPKGIKERVRAITEETRIKVSRATLAAQEILMYQLDNMVGWHNLTGNAYTGIVSAAYVRTARLNLTKQYAQLPGVKGRKATRGKISAGKYKSYRRKINGESKTLKYPRARVYIGRRFDRPTEYFFIKERGQFVETSGGNSYKEAVAVLNNFHPAAPQPFNDGGKAITAAIKIVTGTPEYQDKLIATNGSPIMLIAIQKAEEVLQEQLKEFL